ncbi:MAG: hypothetical protein N3F03_01640 [Ignavibacteria bacterium]|nr:hypothetical protein [Ignavibacteria bacterium]
MEKLNPMFFRINFLISIILFSTSQLHSKNIEIIHYQNKNFVVSEKSQYLPSKVHLLKTNHSNLFFHSNEISKNINHKFLSDDSESLNFQIGGYSKYLFSSYRIQNLSENLIDHTLHSRINLKYFINDNITFNLGIRNRIIYGESVEKIPNYINSISEDEYFYNLKSFIWKEKKSVNLLEIDRLWTEFNFEKIQFSLGRQRIAWGTSWVWNISDLFNPLSILDFDYEERPASDGVRFQYFPTSTSKIEFASKFGKNKKDLSSAFEFYYNVWEYDFYFLIGYHRFRPVTGFLWSGDISDAGFRGEILISSPPQSNSKFSNNTFSNEKRIQLCAVISLDYTFSNSFYIHSEIMYNHIGKTKDIGLFRNDAFELGMLSPSKWNLFYQLGYNLSPLTRIDLITLHNPLDKSFVILPNLSYSVSDNLDLSLIALHVEGDVLDEYSPMSSMFFVRLKYSF